MNEIKNVILCGLGAIGSVYAEKLNNADCNFKVLVDENRFKRYSENPVIYNNSPLKIEYILPDEQNFKADLIIITTKMSGLKAALAQMKNFVSPETIIIPLLNGVTSEHIIADIYGREKVLYAYFFGHSAIRTGSNITHDGVNTIVFGSDNQNDKKIINVLKNFFDKADIHYEISQDIKHALWAKFMLNVSANPTTALFGMTFGEMLNNRAMMDLAVKIMREVQSVAKAEGVNNSDRLIDETLENLKKMIPDGKTSMLQDVEAGRHTEIDTFAGAIIELGEKHNIKTPYCQFLKDAFGIIHENIEKSRLKG